MLKWPIDSHCMEEEYIMYYEDNDQEAYLEYVKMRNEQLKEQSRIETERDEKEKLAIKEQMAIYNETYGDYDARDKYSDFCNDIKTSLVETALNVLFEPISTLLMAHGTP